MNFADQERQGPAAPQSGFSTNTPSGGGSQPGAEGEPIISLPKGGGALKGIGEKFDANPANGTASLSVPIAVHPGRSGFGPQLSLSYNSGSGNGPFGLGWSLSLPSISRRTDKGLPQYNDSLDTFVLSGAEDLVPVTADNATQGDSVASRAGYRVQRYCPRIEGLFARIEKWTSTNDAADVHWRSISSGNITTLYGQDPNSRIVDPKDSSRIFQWLMCASYDKRGNSISFEYKAEDSAGVPLDHINERNRTSIDRSANKYLKHIRYGNRVPRHQRQRTTDDDEGYMFQVVFDYGEHNRDDPRPDDAGLWPRREDPFSTYRPTFECRTYRLCRRVLVFHRIPEELGEPVTLTRSISLKYKQSPHLTLLAAIYQSGHARPTAHNPSDGMPYITRSIPPVEFHYTQVPTPDELSRLEPQEVDARYLENLPRGVDGEKYRWVDLDGDGLPSVLSEANGCWLYKRNTSAQNFPTDLSSSDNTRRSSVSFAPTRTVPEKPSSLSLLSGSAAFLDIDGDGVKDLIQWERVPGYYPRVPGKMNRYWGEQGNDSFWGQFRPFTQWPLDNSFNNQSIRVVDVTGDGIVDMLHAEQDIFTWYPSLADAGFGSAHIVYGNRGNGPQASFSEPGQTFHLVDLSGDGLSDLVKVENSSVCYWPNLGYGRFGQRVVMDNSPSMDSYEQFDPQRVRFADIDGSGTFDLLYLTSNGVKLHRNLAGNCWGDEEFLLFPGMVSQTTVDLIDLFGLGTTCLVWSSPLPGDSTSPLRYLDLMNGTKPYLLNRVVNNLGAETRIHYAPSTYFSLKDAEEGKPWVSRLPFPIHCVHRSVRIDYAAKSRFTSRYAYHHGCYDGHEREFAGFAFVEQYDTEEYLHDPDSSPGHDGDTDFANLDPASFSPPVHTKMWFHPGIYIHDGDIVRELARDFFGAPLTDELDFDAFLKTLLPIPAVSYASGTLTGPEMRDAYGALRGLALRQEIYADDTSPDDPQTMIARSRIPYSISESTYTVKVVQRQGANRTGVFFAHSAEHVNTELDREPADPRTSHELVLDVDEFGNVRRSVSVSYGRISGQSPLDLPDAARQEELHVLYAEASYTNKMDGLDDLILPLSCENRSYEITGVTPPGTRFDRTDFTRNGFALLDGLAEIPYEEAATPGIAQKRLIGRSRTLYRRDDMTELLPLGQIQSRALPGVGYEMAMTPGLLDRVFQRTRPDGSITNLLPNPPAVLRGGEGGYVDLDGDGRWWVPSGRGFFHPDPNASPAEELALAMADFFLPRRMTDIFGNSSTIIFDTQKLLPVESVDALENRISSINDYRVMQPRLVTDPNGNRGEALFDALGFAVASAVKGKEGEHLGDSLDTVRADLSQSQIDQFFSNPRGPIAKDILGTATSRFVYDIGRFYHEPDISRKKPCAMGAISRQNHASDGISITDLKTMVSISYFDGFERQIQAKLQAEPGPTSHGGASVDPRWLCSGWTIYNNKGLPVRTYEPFFDDTHEFKFGESIGVSPIVLYDAVSRPVVTINPDHSWTKVVTTPWEERTFDTNDTILGDPRTDPDFGALFSKLPAADFLPTWYNSRATGSRGPEAEDAAIKAAAHANTPPTMHSDSMGRVFLSIADCGPAGLFESRMVLDIQGNQREAIDAKGRVIGRYIYDMLGSCLFQSSMESGERWSLMNAARKSQLEWNSRGYTFHHTYDELQRPVGTSLREEETTGEALLHRTVYGERQTDFDPKIRNLRGQVLKVYDQAGVVESGRYDFKGNLLSTVRQFASNYKTALDWSQSSIPLDSRRYKSAQTLDALSRVVTSTEPDGTTSELRYDESGALVSISANLKGETNSAGESVWTPFITNIKYDAHGQRESVRYINGTISEFTYDAETFRLVRLSTKRASDTLQDLNYSYDPAGNITSIRDHAQQTIFFRGQRVEPSTYYTYDPLYRLIQATGREHLGQVNNTPQAPTPPAAFDRVHTRHDHPGNSAAMGTYLESYTHDPVGNIQSVSHAGSQPASSGWSTTYFYEEPSQLSTPRSGIYSNRLSRRRTARGVIDNFAYSGSAGLHGLITSMRHLTAMQWNELDQLRSTSRQHVTNSQIIPETTYYVYNASGQRVRKVTERQGSASRMKEDLYIGEHEIHRKYRGDGSTIRLERETLRISDGGRQVALVETRTQGTDSFPARLIRYQYDNHMGSVCLELNETGRIVSYEEYYPYGGTSYQATSSITEVPKRYRYAGAERDDESGLDYRGGRYYAAWIGRWIAADPGGLIDGPNLYCYAHCNPIGLSDASGFAAESPEVDWRGDGFRKDMSQDEVRRRFAELDEPIYYKGSASWEVDATGQEGWVVPAENAIPKHAIPDNYFEPGAMITPEKTDGGGGASAEAPAPSGPQPGQKDDAGGNESSLVGSFVKGAVKGAVIGFAVGFALAAVGVVLSGPALLVVAGIGVALTYTQAKQIWTGKDAEGNTLSDNQRAEMAGELAAGFIAGGVGSKLGKAARGLVMPKAAPLEVISVPASTPRPTVLGQRVADSPEALRVWNSVMKPNAKGKPRTIYKKHWRRFWRAVRKPENADAQKYFTDAGFEFPVNSKTTAPFHTSVGNNKFGRLSLDHMTKLGNHGSPTDPSNLRWMIQGDNTNIQNLSMKIPNFQRWVNQGYHPSETMAKAARGQRLWDYLQSKKSQ